MKRCMPRMQHAFSCKMSCSRLCHCSTGHAKVVQAMYGLSDAFQRILSHAEHLLVDADAQHARWTGHAALCVISTTMTTHGLYLLACSTLS